MPRGTLNASADDIYLSITLISPISVSPALTSSFISEKACHDCGLLLVGGGLLNSVFSPRVIINTVSDCDDGRRTVVSDRTSKILFEGFYFLHGGGQ